MSVGIINLKNEISFPQFFRNRVEFKVDDKVKAVVVDGESKEIIREIPSDKQPLKMNRRVYA